MGFRAPVVVGVIEGMNREFNPLVQLVAKPLDPRLQVGGVRVLVRGTGWASIDGQRFPIIVMAVEQAQFRLVDADTTNEAGFSAGGTISVDG